MFISLKMGFDQVGKEELVWSHEREIVRLRVTNMRDFYTFSVLPTPSGRRVICLKTLYSSALS